MKQIKEKEICWLHWVFSSFNQCSYLQSFLECLTFTTTYIQTQRTLTKQKMTALVNSIYPIFIMLHYKQPSFIQVSYVLFLYGPLFLLGHWANWIFNTNKNHLHLIQLVTCNIDSQVLDIWTLEVLTLKLNFEINLTILLILYVLFPVLYPPPLFHITFAFLTDLVYKVTSWFHYNCTTHHLRSY